MKLVACFACGGVGCTHCDQDGWVKEGTFPIALQLVVLHPRANFKLTDMKETEDKDEGEVLAT